MTRLRALSAALPIVAGLLALVVAVALAVVEGSPALAVAIAGCGLIAAGFALHARRAVRADREVSRQIMAGLASDGITRLAVKSALADIGVINRLLTRLSGETERGVRLAVVKRLVDLPADVPSGVDGGLISAILSFASQRVILAGDSETVRAYRTALGALSPTTKVLDLPTPEHLGSFFDQLAAEGRSRQAPVPVIAATTAEALTEVVEGEAAAHLLTRYRVSEFLVVTVPRARTRVRSLSREAPVRATAVGSTAVIIAWRTP